MILGQDLFFRSGFGSEIGGDGNRHAAEAIDLTAAIDDEEREIQFPAAIVDGSEADALQLRAAVVAGPDPTESGGGGADGAGESGRDDAAVVHGEQRRRQGGGGSARRWH